MGELGELGRCVSQSFKLGRPCFPEARWLDRNARGQSVEQHKAGHRLPGSPSREDLCSQSWSYGATVAEVCVLAPWTSTYIDQRHSAKNGLDQGTP